ncbi:unnamed protein product [Hermetia illucens]|uniref:Mediator of RNA polymerase II transcription subunit 27 n=1 Tax=Hermetia illucens TaxID=343691 RepID=A0A7R8Z325_HERIL|nr:mediator of RNA polymerase II transcription subunit 27 [Hermetia illucens]CAD7093483.1 unnamed protein product [Hermetia illucens]
MDSLNNALSAIKNLRSSVGHVFEVLANGVQAHHGDDGRDSKFLVQFQELFNNVNLNLREVESVINGLTPPPAPFNLGHTAALAQETTDERQALYSQLVNSYKWVDKIHEYSFLANNILNCNSLRRSYISYSNKRGRLQISSCNNTSPQHVDKVLNELSLNSLQTNYKIWRPFGSNAVVIVNIGRILKAAIVFKGVMIEWVTVKGFDESLDVDDLWTESRYEVFRKVQEQTHSAMLHFFSPTLPDLAVKSYMTWIHSYNKLFTEPCRRCGKYLYNALPPTWRDLRTLEPFHEECKNC